MTSKNLSYKTLVRRNLSSRLWAVALAVLGCLGALLFPVFVIQQDFTHRMETVVSGLRYDSDAEILHRAELEIYNMLSYDGPAIKIVLSALAILCGVAMFRYLHDRQQVDFFHALPVKRGRLFVLNYVSGLLLVLPVFVIVYAISIAVANGMGLGGQMTADVVLQSVLGNIAYFLLNYTIAVLCTILTGNTIITVLLGIWVEFSVSFWVQMAESWKSIYFRTYFPYDIPGRFDVFIGGSPILKYFLDTPRENAMPFDAVQTPSLMILVYPAVLTVILLALSYVLFVCRKSERAGLALAFEPTKAPFRWYMSLFMGSGLALVFHSFFVNNSVWIWIGLVLGVMLCHAVVEIVYEFDFKALFHHWKQMIVLCVVAVAALFCMRADVFGYDRYLPDKEDIAEVGFCDMGSYGYYDSRIHGTATLTDPESIQLVYEMAQKLTAETSKNRECISDDDSLTEVYIHYVLKNGKHVGRRYHSGYRLLGDALDDLITSEAYIKMYEPLQQVKLPDNAKNGEFVMTISPQMIMWSSMPSDVSLDNAKDIQRIIDTLCEEQIANVHTHLREIPVMGIQVTDWYRHDRVEPPERGVWVLRMLETIPVYPSDTKTLELIETLTGRTPIPVTADALTSLVVEVEDPSMEKQDIQPGGSTHEVQKNKRVSVTDPDVMNQLVKNLYTEQQVRYAGRQVVWENFEEVVSLQIQVQYKGNVNDTIRMYYPKGKAPIALLEQLTGVSLTEKQE